MTSIRIRSSNPSAFLTTSFYLVGLWPSEKSSIFYTIFGYVFQSIFFFFYTSFKCLYFFTTTEMQEIVFCAFVSLTEVALFVKNLNMHFRSHVFQNHLKRIEAFEMENDTEAKLLDGRLKILRKMLFAYIGLVMVTGAFSYSVPFFTDDTSLPYLAWYPVNWQNNSRTYWMVYAYQIIGMVIQSHTLVCMEMYTVYIFVVLSTQYDILSERLKKIGNVKNNGDDCIDIQNNNKNIKQNTTACLISCIRNHREITR